MFRGIITVVVFFFEVSVIWGQHAPLDSLNKAYADTKKIHEKINTLHALTILYTQYDLVKALETSNEAYNLSLKLNYAEGIVQSLTDIGYYHFLTGDYPAATAHYRKAISQAQAEKFDNYSAITLINLAEVFRVQSLFDSANFYYQKAQDVLLANPVKSTEAFLLNSWGMLHYDLSDHTKALTFFNRAHAFSIALNDSLLITECWKRLILSYTAQDQFSTAEEYLVKLRSYAARHQNPSLSVFYDINQAEVFFKKGEFLQATKLFTRAMDTLTTYSNPRYLARALKNVGQIYEWQGDYQRALEFFFKALRIDEALHHQQEVARTYDMMSWVYVNQKNFARAQYYALKSLAISNDINDDFGRSDYYTLSGYMAFVQGKYQRSLQYYDSSLTIRKWFDARLPVANVLNFIARVHTAQGQYNEAIKISNQVFGINASLGNKIGIVTYYNNMSDIAMQIKNYTLAEQYALQALNESRVIKSGPQLRRALSSLSNLYTTQKKYPEAIHYYQQYIYISDSLYNAESSQRQAQLNALYELDKREQQIKDLNEQTTTQKALLMVQQGKLKFQNTVLIFSIVGIILLAALAYVLFQYYRNKNRANRELNLLNRQISEKTEEIQAQSEELIEANGVLTKLNYELLEKQEEIAAQSEELREANQMISEINHDLENIINKRTLQLKEAYKELDTFFYRSSHDFRRPLTTFMGLAEVAKVTVKDAYALELFEKVKETARNLDKMLVKLQSISDVGAQELVYKPVLIREIFDNVCSSFEEELRRKDVNTVCDINLKQPFISYPAMIKIIIENLIENSIHFSSPSQPAIHFSAHQLEDIVVIEVKDNGHGVAIEYQEKIFDMYFRASERSKGNGLGLYIVKKAIAKLSGTISISSAVGIGTTFTVILPMEAAN